MIAHGTMFNLVPCANSFEAEFADFLDECDDVAAFIKNTGPQKLMIDYLSPAGRPAIYWPDFVVRLTNGNYLLVETKGQSDDSVALKAKAAAEWCKTASGSGANWSYVFVSQVLFEANSEFSMEALARACLPKLRSLLDSLKNQQIELPFEQTAAEVKQERAEELLGSIDLSSLVPRLRSLVEEAVSHLAYDKRMGHSQFGAAFQVLLAPWEDLSGAVLTRELKPCIPMGTDEQRYYFEPYLSGVPQQIEGELKKQARNLRKNILFAAHNNRIGNLLFCLSLGTSARFSGLNAGGVWDDVVQVFGNPGHQALVPVLNEMNDFRNKYVVHGETPLTDVALAEQAMRTWVRGLLALQGSLV